MVTLFGYIVLKRYGRRVKSQWSRILLFIFCSFTVAHHSVDSTWHQTRDEDLFRLRVGERLYGRYGSVIVTTNKHIHFDVILFTGVCKIYEEHLKKLNPKSVSITYDITQLFEFIDHLADLSCLVYVDKLLNTMFKCVY